MNYLGCLVPGQGISPLKQKIKAITDLAATTNITEARHMIGLIGYYRKFFPIFSDMIRPLNELTKKNVPFKWTKQCQKSLDYVKQVMTTNLILVYPDLDKQHYLFMDSSKDTGKGRWYKIESTPPHHIPEQNFPRIPKELEHFNKRGICYLHVPL